MAKKRKPLTPEPPVKAQPGAIGFCERCGMKLQVAAARNENSAPFRLAAIPKGFCADCVVTQFLYDTYPINMQLDERGPGVLLHPQMREAMLMSGILEGCDMNVDEINWQRIVHNWGLPVECRKSATNPYEMGSAARERKMLHELEDAVVAGNDMMVDMMVTAGTGREAAKAAIDEHEGSVIATRFGVFNHAELAARRSLRQIVENCRFCGGRGCLSCETELRKARESVRLETLQGLTVDGGDTEIDANGIVRCTDRVM